MKYISPELEIVRFSDEKFIVASGVETPEPTKDDTIGSDTI